MKINLGPLLSNENEWNIIILKDAKNIIMTLKITTTIYDIDILFKRK